MELITAQALWKDYDLKALPLSETILSTEYKERYTIEYVYFNGEAALDGCTRIYAQLYTPSSIPSGAGVVLMNDINEPFDTTYVDLLVDSGYTVLVVDYAGKRDVGRHTIYPQSLDYANFFGENGGFKLPFSATEAKKSCWYVYATVMARGFVFLQSREEIDKTKISFFGVRRGALNVYKAAYLAPEACAAVALFNSSCVSGIDTSSPDAMLYNTCLSPGCYASQLKVPTYIVEGSNNGEDSLFETNELYKVASEQCRFYIAEHSDNILMPYQRKSIIAFLNSVCFARGGLPSEPRLEAKNSERSLYYEIAIDRAENAQVVKLHYFYGKETGAYRNWSNLSLQRVSESEYLCKAAIYLHKEETSAFASVIYDNGLILSGEIITKTPYLMGVDETQVVRSRLIYEVDMGTTDWLIMDKRGFGEISIKSSEVGIEGVTSSVNSLTTLKIGDLHTCGDRDGSLQLLVHSEEEQTITLSVVCRSENGYIVYECNKRLVSYGEWSKITLSSDELRSKNGLMHGWDDAVGITVRSEKKLLINSLLWI